MLFKKSLCKFLSIVIMPALVTPCFAAVQHGKADSAEEKGLAIIQEAERRDTGWHDASADMTMTLGDAHGEKSVRRMHSESLEGGNGDDKSLVVIEEPPDVKGTALLTHAHNEGSDDQWLYLPALKRVKRIAGANKSGPFMGSEFAYEDLTALAIAKFRFKYLRDDTLDSRTCFVIERVPLDKDSGYSRQVVWMDRSDYLPRKVEFYDRNGEILKTLTITDYEKFLDKFWRAHKLEMVNHQTGKSTTIEWTNIKLNQGLTDSDFNVNSLRRG